MRKDYLQTQNETNSHYIDSREVAEMLEKKHSNLLRDINTYCEYLAEINFDLGSYFLESTYFDKNQQQRSNYQITKKGCEFLAHKLTGKKGAIFTAKYIERFHQMEKFIDDKGLKEELHRLYGTPRNYQESLLLLVEKENKIEELEKEVQIKEQEITDSKPKVEFYDVFAELEGLMGCGDVAKFLCNFGYKVGRTRFMQWLRSEEYLCSSEGQMWNKPRQQYIEHGYMEVKTNIHYSKYGEPIGWVNTPFFTPKGVQYIAKKYIKFQEEMKAIRESNGTEVETKEKKRRASMIKQQTKKLSQKRTRKGVAND